MNNRKHFFKEIEKRCQEQDKQWGGPDHDDHHSSHNWIAFICKFLGRAAHYPFNAYIFQNAMIDIAALSVQAASWNERIMIPKLKKEREEALEALEKHIKEKPNSQKWSWEDFENNEKEKTSPMFDNENGELSKTTEYLNDR